MPMGIVSDDEFLFEQFNSAPKPSPAPNLNPLPPPSERISLSEVVDMIPKGRGQGNIAVPDSLRKVIGEESAINGRQSALQLGKAFGISPSSVSAYDNGSHSTASYNEQPNLSHINESKERIAKRARGKLQLALKHLTNDKLEGCKAVDLSNIAKNMSVVVKQMEPEVARDESKSGPTFIFYAPQARKEDAFETIVLEEKG